MSAGSHWEMRNAPLKVAPATPTGKNIWGGTTFQAASRFLICAYFFFSAASKVYSFDKETGGPVMSWFGPRLDNFFAGIKDMTGFTVPVTKAIYPQLLLVVSGMEFVGAVLFASDVRFGAWLMVFVTSLLSIVVHNFWDYQHRPPIMQNEMSHFLKNVAIIGGLLHYLASNTGTRHKNRYERTMEAIRAEVVAEGGPYRRRPQPPAPPLGGHGGGAGEALQQPGTAADHALPEEEKKDR